jgi:hypothetical protein
MQTHGTNHRRLSQPDLTESVYLLDAKIDAIAALVNLIQQKVDGLIKTHENAASSFSIASFLRRNELSPSQYFKLQRAGRGPRVMRTGDVGIRISRQAELDWIAARERDAAQQEAP